MTASQYDPTTDTVLCASCKRTIGLTVAKPGPKGKGSVCDKNMATSCVRITAENAAYAKRRAPTKATP